ncbi:HPr kinase/phosphorylase [Sphingosinicella sp. BN140058]|uniref:HPr kinase/phosphorylase n=1 Tax=Sphingosinicella sp. BN140058 TaxID=1892855 RepID=UPI00101064AC|nr:hypothetical protein [Sphingosinicella sp. BN140058]QAY78470.1 hypothetical protein ETR14_19435 [Sphingosinicella sp. BN140058]
MATSSLPAATATHLYRAYGMTIAVERPVPRLTRLPSRGGDEPIVIEFGTVPQALPNAETYDDYFQATTSEYLFRQPEKWGVLVRDGRWARFEAMTELSDELFWYLAVTNAVGVAGYQRGLFPVHGSGVMFPSGMVAFVGPSGAGKTSLTAGMVLRGHPLFADDLCLIRPEGGTYVTGKGAPELRLLRDAADALGWDRERSIGHQPTRDKFAFVQDDSGIDEAPVRAVVELAFEDGPPRLERLGGVAPFAVLVAAIRLRMGLHLFPRALRPAAFDLVSRMAREIPVYRFTRPRDYGAFAAGADLLSAEFGH